MQDIVGKTFGNWVVISYEGKRSTIRHWYLVRCVCGNESVVERNILKRGKTTQCRFCARKNWAAENTNPAQTHGFSSPTHPQFHLHYIWCSIKQRCNNPKVKNFHRYGGRGIKMCLEWEDSFEKFLFDVGERPAGYSIDRIDNEKGYYKENCRWATKEENCNNTYKTIIYEFNGKRLSETQWSRELGISRNKLMWWARKYGIQWVIENIESLKKIRRGMSDKEYLELGLSLPSKCWRP